MAHECPVCDSASANKKALEMHISENHAKCGECEKVLKDASALQQHMADVHGIGEKPKKEKPKYVLFEQRLNYKRVGLQLFNGETLFGKVHVNPGDRFDIRLETDDGNSLVIPKHSIVYYFEGEKPEIKSPGETYESEVIAFGRGLAIKIPEKLKDKIKKGDKAGIVL